MSRMVLRQSALLAGTGLAIGAAGAVPLARIAKGLLYGVEPADPVALGVAFGFLGLVAATAALVPAMRAARLDPATTLRGE